MEPRFCADWETDKRISENLKHLLPERGMACDVGANEGVAHDGTLWLEDLGWIVLCIEPIPQTFKELRQNRRLCINVACGSIDSEEKDFNIYGSYPHASNSALVESGSVGENRVKVNVRRLDRILEEAGFDYLDYLMIDVEGSEQDVLDGFTLDRWKSKIIVVESWDEKPVPVLSGYRNILRNTLDNIYVREDLA